MLSFKGLRRGSVSAATAIALAVAAACGPPPPPPDPYPRPVLRLPDVGWTSIIDFEDLPAATYIGTQYAAQGVEFVEGPGYSSPGRLSTVHQLEGGNKVAFISRMFAFDSGPASALRCRLRFHARRVQLRVANLGARPDTVRLVAFGRDGEVASDEWIVPMSKHLTYTLTVMTPRNQIRSFEVYARDAAIVVDDIVIDR